MPEYSGKKINFGLKYKYIWEGKKLPESSLGTADFDGSNWYGYARQNPMVYVDRFGLFYYTGNVQQSSNDTKQTDTESAETPSGMPQNQTPNITGGVSSGEPEGVYPMVQAPKDTYAFQDSDKSENSAKKSLIDEFFDIFDLCSVGIRDEFSINVPNIFMNSKKV